jgi:hypothetical protein
MNQVKKKKKEDKTTTTSGAFRPFIFVGWWESRENHQPTMNKKENTQATSVYITFRS